MTDISFNSYTGTFQDVKNIWNEKLWPNRKSTIKEMSSMQYLDGFDMAIYEKYKPKNIYVITSENEIKILKDKSNYWKIKNLTLLDEDNFFLNKYGLTKTDIVSQITQNKPNYTPGWLYQQIIKLGANDAIDQLDEVFVVWDADLLPVNSWPILDNKKEKFALLQDKSYGNQDILNSWKNLIINVLGINPVEDESCLLYTSPSPRD